MPDKLRPVVWAIVALLALYFWGNCRESAGASKQRLRDSTVAWNAHSHATDLRVSRLAAESLELGARLMRLQRNDSVARREITRLRLKIPGTQPDSTRGTLESPLPADTLSPSGCAGAPTACDTLIATLLESRAAVDTQLTLWRALAVERGELLQRALQERDGYKAISSAWQRKAEPGALTKLGRALPYIAAGLVIGRVLK